MVIAASWVGKRIIVCKANDDFTKFQWICGIIRCQSSYYVSSPNLKVYVEWDNQMSQIRKWTKFRDLTIVFIEKDVAFLLHPQTNEHQPVLTFHQHKGIRIFPGRDLVEFFEDNKKFFVVENDLLNIGKVDGLSQCKGDRISGWLVHHSAEQYLQKGEEYLKGRKVLVCGADSIAWFPATIVKLQCGGKLLVKIEQTFLLVSVDPRITEVLFADTNMADDNKVSSNVAEASSLVTTRHSSVTNTTYLFPVASHLPPGECGVNMQHSQQSPALPAQQALIRESQKLQSQQQRTSSQLQPQIPGHLLNSPYLQHYGLLYNNPAVGASMLAQAQLQAMAAATGAPPHSLMFPWLKATQQGALDNKDAAQFAQQQALYNALYAGAKPFDGASDYSALLTQALPGASSSSPSPRTQSPKHETLSAQQISGTTPLGTISRDRVPAMSSRIEPHQRDVAHRSAMIADQGAALRERLREDSWKAKYIGTGSRKNEANKDKGVVEKRTSSTTKSWSLDPSNITHTPLGMIDPATYLATHGAHFIRDEASRKNGHLEVAQRDSSIATQSVRLAKTKEAPVIPSLNASPWKGSLQNVSSIPESSNTMSASSHSDSIAPSHGWPRNLTSNPGVSAASSVFNVHSLKYSPPTATTVRMPPSSSRKPIPDKNVIIKTSPAPGNKEGQNVKYISDPYPRQRSPSPEKLGPVMADGSRARVLSPASLSNLYRFPVPSSKNFIVGNQQGAHKTIISTGDYKVTQVIGGSVSGPQSSAPSHVVYAMPATYSSHEVKPVLHQADGKIIRKRTVEADESGIDRKLRVRSPSNSNSNNSPTPPHKPHLRDVASVSDPHLQSLMGAGMLPITGSNISWGDSSNIGSEYPGAPTKTALKDALLGVKKETVLNLSTNRDPDPRQTSPHNSPVSVAISGSSSLRSGEPIKVSDCSSKPTSIETTVELPSTGKVEITSNNRKVVHNSSEPLRAETGLESGSKTPVEEHFKSSLCPKLKKAWIKRSYESKDAQPPTPTVVSEVKVEPSSVDPPLENSDVESGEPPKKAKKKQIKDNKKKQRHKENKKSRKSDSNSDAPDPSSSPRSVKRKDEADARRSNSKLYLLGLFKDAQDSDEDSVEAGGEGKKRKKKKSPANMPLGENGLPVSVLLCRKEQMRLKRSGEPFMQDAACHELSSMYGISIHSNNVGLSSLPKCRECRSAKRKDNSAIFCRFYGFRKLVFVNGHLHASGFCDPEDSHASDLSLWLPSSLRGNDLVTRRRPCMELETCRYIMKHVIAKFCDLVHEEREALIDAEKSGKINWKRPVHGVREMCDACETTLFNLHWVCHRCGFGICVDCYRTRQNMSREDMEEYDNDRDNIHRWLKCGKGKHHLPSHLVPTQIIPSSCLFDLCDLAHEVRAKWNITSQCRCKKSSSSAPSLLATRSGDPTPLLKSHCNNELLSHSGGKMASTSKPEAKTATNRDKLKGYDCENSASPLDWLASIALREQRKNSTANPTSASINSDEKKCAEKTGVQTKASSSPLVSAPRSWLCNGQLLQLTDSSSSVNVDTFQLHWFYGMPVMASGASENMNRELWKPETFSAEHGSQPTGSALVNCRGGSIITNALIRDFWNGFEKIENRLRDEKSGEKMILKLKDWPTTDDFIDTMPDKFDDLMRALPLPQYTARDGKFNLAAHLPDFFVRPDLGPKMYIAYGWVTERDWNQGTTNLHLDISDACNLMVYVGVPDDEPPEALETLIDIIKEGDADDAQVERARTLKPGALWHIFKADDTDKIRSLILKVKTEEGMELSDDNDPIHDQQIYLDKGLRRRLREEYGVEGYPLVQCEGDSVFIPAGAPHQVFNLHSCIKVAEDFVSPEHVDNCFKLTDEFRHLSTTHSNHEDKLQLKNIMYHTIKEVVAAFNWYENAMSP